MQKYRDIGIGLFKQGKFSLAKTSFNLAYRENPSDELLALIELCDSASASPKDALSLFEIYFDPKESDNTTNINELLEILQDPESHKKDIDYENAITYADFKGLMRQNEFKQLFQSVMFSTRIIISDKEELLDFVNNLIENEFYEMGLAYLESSAKMFIGDSRLDKILNKIRTKNENQLK